MNIEIKRIVQQARKAGWRVERRKHFILFPPITIAFSPSDWRAVKNNKARLRRAGLDVKI